jgi:hypothetical protein
MNHYAHIPGKGAVPLPTADYQAGDYVSCNHGSFRLTGSPHREWFGAQQASCNVTWPAEEVTVPAELTRAGRTK